MLDMAAVSNYVRSTGAYAKSQVMLCAGESNCTLDRHGVCEGACQGALF